MQTHPHTEYVRWKTAFSFCSRFHFSSPQQTHANALQNRRLNYLSRRRKWRLSPGWPPPSRCNDPYERDEPWECTELTFRLPFSPPALLDAPLAATAWLSRPGTAARKVHWAKQQRRGRQGWWKACCHLEREQNAWRKNKIWRQRARYYKMEPVKLKLARDGAVQITVCNSYFGTPKAPWWQTF